MSLLEPYKSILDRTDAVGVRGRVAAVRGLTVSVEDFPVPVGAGCRIFRGDTTISARVVGFAGRHALVMPLGPTAGICHGACVEMDSATQTVPVGPGLQGRVVDGLCRAIDGGEQPAAEDRAGVWPGPIAPMRRRRITEPLSTGVRAIDAMLTVGRGQRMGVFSGSGVGKSVLMGMIARNTDADVTVIALIGERGREVRDFIEKDLGPEGLKRSVVVASTSDESPLLRVQAAAVATSIAEYFRDRGCDVLLLMDSLTRFAAAQRQIGLAAGEPPATKGYPPSVFNLLPELLERSGRTETGSITGFYTVLAEGDDLSEPISDAVRSVTDGHIALSRTLATRGHYPAVDCLNSVSRIMLDLVDSEHAEAARVVRRVISLHAEVEELLNVGAYRHGSNPKFDLAIGAIELVEELLKQDITEDADYEDTRRRLKALHAEIQRMGGESAVGSYQAAGESEHAKQQRSRS
ncbi:MAG: FliI/YscN family ATPase [Phycisphaerae bacterium]